MIDGDTLKIMAIFTLTNIECRAYVSSATLDGAEAFRPAANTLKRATCTVDYSTLRHTGSISYYCLAVALM